MKAHLMHRDQDFDLAAPPPPGHAALAQDLELATLFAAMSQGDKWISEVVDKAVLASSTDVGTILYRQSVLRDCIEQEGVVRDLYSLAVETIETKRKNYYTGGLHYPSSNLYGSLSIMEMLVDRLRRLRAIADQHSAAFKSEGFRTLLAMLARELGDDYLATIGRHLKQLRFKRGTLVSARLGEGNKGVDYVLRAENAPQDDWIGRLIAPRPPAHSFRLAERDEAGARALSELRDRGINLAADALAQSADHIVSFFRMLRTELAFYVGCLNLHAQLRARRGALCFPRPAVRSARLHAAAGLYDACLALRTSSPAIGNDLGADGKDLVIVTGANQGGKSTFLRSIGLAQLMMQCGMFVAADAFQASVCERLFTHYRREEDATMSSGKFDEELVRMSAIVDAVVPGALILFNESFAATNEREGSEVARQIVAALIEQEVRVFFVTHQYEFAHGFYAKALANALFLRAGREASGARTFRIAEGEPLRTSHGEDLYKRIFADAATA